MNNQENVTQASEAAFSYSIKKDNKVFIYWYDIHIKTLSGEKAEKFLSKIQGVDEVEAQQLMAKLTGNIKRKRDENTNTIVIRGSFHTRNKNNDVL